MNINNTNVVLYQVSDQQVYGIVDQFCLGYVITARVTISVPRIKLKYP